MNTNQVDRGGLRVAARPKEKEMLQPVLDAAPGLYGVARGDRDGVCYAQTGDIDGDTLCAVAVMAHRAVQSSADTVALGYPEAWSYATTAATWYVVHLGDWFIVVSGDSSKRPEAVLAKIRRALGSKYAD